MNPQQQTALDRPCRDYKALTHKRYRQLVKGQGVFYSVVMTVNVGLDDADTFDEPGPVWHLSVAQHDKKTCEILSNWTPLMLQKASFLAHTLFSGAGNEAMTHQEFSGGCLHWRRPLTDKEKQRMNEKDTP